ncbi:DUF2384 domain-containing protein [Steroidobacter sp. S1-65]|uniref:DUF2384 domain-containing protein n=1 Tax=Steroidobacter gossypii TaxID=2805490 RepID=A0ABS1WXU2_9GAMM|nr:MbcA/ParS/Xre antitoxin family protein [Steroidobacter gossypii]MBM0105801.1 DUF2384 domain-containing protein [Steroidobacter gossypii]
MNFETRRTPQEQQTRAVQVFNSKEKARDWLKKQNPALQGEVPLELLATDAGAELVTDELTRIDYGDLY